MDRFENFSTRAGAKAGVAGRSRRELPVAYFVAKFGLDPAASEPLHFASCVEICRKFSEAVDFADRFEKFSTRGSASWGAGRSGQMLHVAYFVANLASTQPRTGPGKIANFRLDCGIFGDFVDFFADRFEKFSTRGGAKAGAAGRSRQMLRVAYFVAKFGLDPAANEPRQIWQIVADFRH